MNGETDTNWETIRTLISDRDFLRKLVKNYVPIAALNDYEWRRLRTLTT